jgi:hypothetical protein
MSQAMSAFAETQTIADADCFTQLEQDTQVGDSVTVITNDSTVIRGTKPTVILTSSNLYMRRMGETGLVGNVTIPFEKINRITYRKPSHARWILALAGLAVGATAGGFAGYRLDSGEKGWLDFSRLGSAVFGGMIGGLIGMAGGYKIGNSITIKVTLECR